MDNYDLISIWTRLGSRDRRRRVRPYVLLLTAEQEPSDLETYDALDLQAEADAWRQLEAVRRR